ncbi:MAG: hypothetical protein HYY76_02465 [Acidobacteria bacterium]|nr:hypothetical protein [Acidobacteriota bacterium]
MKRWERWSLNSLSLILAVTGFVYLWMKYLMEPPDPFAVVNHPWQTAMLNLHVIASPLFILVFGIAFNSHVMRKLGAPRLPNRLSGYVSLGSFAVMVLSGYLLQVTTSDWWLQALVVVHIAGGALFTLVYAAHLVISLSLARTRQEARAGSPIGELA